MLLGRNIQVECFLLLSFLTIHTTSIESITGKRASCTNEGETVVVDSIKDLINCYSCICQNGFVECESEKSCPPVQDCYMLERKKEKDCCEKCKGCIYKGKKYSSDEEWSDSEDPCSSLKCVAGVVTETNLQCYTTCNKPQPPLPGQCCPTCLGCHVNGQLVLEGREVTLSDDPCLKCSCINKRLQCVKKACPVLQCPLTKQIRISSECCPRCSEKRQLINFPNSCILGNGYYVNGDRFEADRCTKCACINGTSICRRNTCPVLECSPKYQKTVPGDCCPHCPEIAELKSTCTYEGNTYQNNQTWDLNACSSCRCHFGEIRCAKTNCPKKKCRANQQLITPTGQCCAVCEEKEGICTVYGDPHYKTFDGKHYSFQGSCKYLLTADCRTSLFSIRVTNDGRNTKMAAWTKTVTLKVGGVKVNLGQKMRIKVNGTRIPIPFKIPDILTVHRNGDQMISVSSTVGVKLLWDGYSFLQVFVDTSYKGKLCGLCGNYNNVWRDDLISKQRVNYSDGEAWKFANSWKVGGVRACSRKNENLSKPFQCKSKKGMARCKPLSDFADEQFGACGSRLSPSPYHEACIQDMCECPTGKCFCESFAAYAHECVRLGVKVPDWKRTTNCDLDKSKLNTIRSQTTKRHNRKIDKFHRRHDFLRKHVPKTFLIESSSHKLKDVTPVPLF